MACVSFPTRLFCPLCCARKEPKGRILTQAERSLNHLEKALEFTTKSDQPPYAGQCGAASYSSCLWPLIKNMALDPTYPDTVTEASVSHHGPNPKALSRLDIPQSSVVATNQRQNEAETCQSEMQGWWDQSIRKYLGLPDGYQKVSVLLIKWDDEIDQLKVKQEVITSKPLLLEIRINRANRPMT